MPNDETPRTMREAFGQHANLKITEPKGSIPGYEWAIYAVGVAVAVLGLLGVL